RCGHAIQQPACRDHSAGIVYPRCAGLISTPVRFTGMRFIALLDLRDRVVRDGRRPAERRDLLKRILESIEQFAQQLKPRIAFIAIYEAMTMTKSTGS